MIRSIEELKLAGLSLAAAESRIERGDKNLVKSYTSNAIKHAIRAVIFAFLEEEIESTREGILRAMEFMPPQLWGEALRLLEILRLISINTLTPSINLAREAIEIATGIIMYTLPEQIDNFNR